MKKPDCSNETLTSRDEPSREPLPSPAALRDGGKASWRAMVVKGILTPYTHRLYEAISERHDIDLHIRTCADAEPGRQWQLPEAKAYSRATLRGLRWHRGYVSHVYVNPGVVLDILRLRPDVVVVCDFSPTMFLAAVTARLIGIPVALGSDTQIENDPGGFSLPHRLARRMMAPLVSAAIGASRSTINFFVHYGIDRDRTVISPLAPAWQHVGPAPGRDERAYDLLFCGFLDDRVKGALHFLKAVAALKARGRSFNVRVVGDGPLRQQMQDELDRLGVEARFDGYLQQAELAEAYLSSKLLLFPSRGDSWGLAANEAAQCGTPVIISPHAQAAFGLVERFGCGAVVPLDVETWAAAIERYLDDGPAWHDASMAGLASRREFSIPAAADSFFRGMEIARGGTAPSRQQANAIDEETAQ